MTELTIDELSIPASIDSPDAGDFVEMTRVRNDIEAEVAGNYDLAYEPAELLPGWQNTDYEPRRLFVARLDGRIVGRGIYETTASDESTTAWLTVEILPAMRRRGIGAAIYDTLESLAAAEGRTVLQSYIMDKADFPGARIPSPTGFGSVALGSPGSRFALARGFALGQVERVSRLALPSAPGDLERQLATAQSVAGADYLPVYWSGRTPVERLDDIALLRTRMGTDAPTAGLDPDATPWDAARVADWDDRLETNPRVLITAAVEHVPSGRLVAFTELSVPPEPTRPVEQHDTLVLSEHRGRRLGMLAKAVNLLRLQREHPGHPSVTTFNAEENRHMLSVNEALGFVAVGYEGAWRRVLDAH